MRRSWVAFALLALAIAGFLETGHQLFLRLTYLMLALIAVSFFWAWLGIEGLRFSRRVGTRGLHVGEVAREKLTLKNRGPFPKLWVEVRDGSTLPGHRGSRVASSLWPFSGFEWEVETPCLRRGKYRLGPVTLASGDPLGLFRMERRLPGTMDFFVFPPTLELGRAPADIGVLPGGGGRSRPSPHITTDVASIRSYTYGDSFNRIHWRSTARLGELMVKEFDLEPMGKVWLFLDLEERAQAGMEPGDFPSGKGANPLPLPPNTVEYAVAIVASLVKKFLGEDMAVGVVAYGQERHVVPLDRGPRQYIRLMELLALVQGEGEVPFAQSIIAESTRLGPDTFVVAVSPSSEPDWVRTLESLAHKGVRSVGVVLDAASFPGDGPPPEKRGEALAPQGVDLPLYTVRCGDRLEGFFAPRISQALRMR